MPGLAACLVKHPQQPGAHREHRAGEDDQPHRGRANAGRRPVDARHAQAREAHARRAALGHEADEIHDDERPIDDPADSAAMAGKAR